MILVIFLFAIIASLQILIAHICPGGKSICRDSATCCLIDAGIYGCCPMKDAVCCDDHTHCCPPATKCDMVHGQCLQNEISVSQKNKEVEYLTKETRISKNKQLLRIYNDGNNSCNISHTCCKGTHDKHCRCCPFKDAVCCQGVNYCCPKNYRHCIAAIWNGWMFDVETF